jgi:hypothetical protein
VRHPLPWLALALLATAPVRGQELEPRAFSQTPVGMNFALLTLGYATGDLLFDQSVPIEDATGEIRTVSVGYARSLALFGASAKLAVVVPYGVGDWAGQLDGRRESASRHGFTDPAVQLSVNFLGAPALRMRDLTAYREGTVAGIAVLTTVPVGQYDPARLINLGTSRWAVRPRLGASHNTGRWTLEAMGSVWLYQDNDDFYGNRTLSQDPLWSCSADAIYRFRRGFWLGVGAALVSGGRTAVDGVAKDTYQRTDQFGAILSYPLNRRHSLKLVYVAGLRTRVGADFDSVSLTWQVGWGGEG